jgi:ADP-ribose pyrophosphatase
MLKKISEKLIYSDSWLDFYQDKIELPNGEKGTYAYAKRQNGVGVVVVSKKGKILLHKEHRYVINDYSWEIQGGGIEKWEGPTEAAVRELKEEAGIKVDEKSLFNLGAFYPLNSFNTELVTIYMVIVDSEELGENETEAGEDLEKRQFFSFDEIFRMIENGEISDLITANAIQLAVRKFEGMS